MLRCWSAGTEYQIRHSHRSARPTARARVIKAPRAGDSSATVEQSLRVVDESGTWTYQDQIEFVQVGRFVAALHVNTDDKVDYRALRDRLAQILAERMRAIARIGDA
jgi:hypothetical protein